MIQRLKAFTPVVRPASAEDALRSEQIVKVVCFCLGPSGTNIEQAATKWLERMGVMHKGEVILESTPEACLHKARQVVEDGVIAVFWTCAVYFHESEFFFTNPDVYPFFFQEEMLLDEMQLAAKPEKARLIGERSFIPAGWLIASHPSPVHLIRDLGCEAMLVNSNAEAAKVCASGETELCITTEKARQAYGLVKIHEFGSPNMVFFGGVTQHGLDQLVK